MGETGKLIVRLSKLPPRSISSGGEIETMEMTKILFQKFGERKGRVVDVGTRRKM